MTQGPVAIVGMACRFPGARTLEAYWANIAAGRESIGPVPPDRIPAAFFDPDSKAVDRFYSRRGGFLDGLTDFDPMAFGIMPKAAEAAEPDQLLVLATGLEAIQDAGLSPSTIPRHRTGVIVGKGNYVSAGVLRLEQHVRTVPQILQTLQDLMPELSAQDRRKIEQGLRQALPHYGPDVASGLIPNLTASRLANRLDLHGPAYTIDAACASSLLAVEQACQLLTAGSVDLMLAGGVHLSHDLTFWATFCQLGAMSRREVCSPFSTEADGILPSEGVGMVALCRLADAQAQGLRIYAVIEGAASASDGRAASLIAPAPEGQLLALQRAWSGLDLQPQDLELLEAHGTGTPTGDAVEVQTVRAFFDGATDGHRRDAVIGSVKSMIGHAMPASGMASLIKTAMAVHTGTLPPSLHATPVHAGLRDSRFRVLDRSEPWARPKADRLAGVNAFGFGGINAHLVLRGHAGSEPNTTSIVSSPSVSSVPPAPPVPTVPAMPTVRPDPQAIPAVLRLEAAGAEAMLAALDAGASRSSGPVPKGHCRLAIVDPSPAKLATARKAIAKGQRLTGRQGIYYSPEPLCAGGGRVALVFPGVDSQFTPRTDGLADWFSALAPACVAAQDPGENLLASVGSILAFNAHLLRCLSQLGLEAHDFAGHSVGEWSALEAAGWSPPGKLAQMLAQVSPEEAEFPDVAFLAAACPASALSRWAAELDPRLSLSHDNCPNQAIVCGPDEAIARLSERLASQGVFHQRLPFRSGFHTPLLSPHLHWIEKGFTDAALTPNGHRVWSATSQAPMPSEPQAAQALALRHLVAPVQFRGLIEAMYDSGVRVFVQVGTGSTMGFVSDTLGDRPHLTLALNQPKRSGIEQMQLAIAGLWAEGAVVNDRLLLAPVQKAPATVTDTVTDTAPAPHTATAPTATTTRTALQLQLGVPFIQIREPRLLPLPLPLHKAQAQAQAQAQALALAPAIESSRSARTAAIPAPTDPIGQKLAKTLDLLVSASDEVLRAWTARRERTSAPQAMAESGWVWRQEQRLCLDTTIPWVRDHALHPQKPGWPILSDWHPVVPMTMSILMMRTAAEQAAYAHGLSSTLRAVRIEQIEAFRWLTVATPITVVLQVRSLGENRMAVEIEGYARCEVVLDSVWPEPQGSLPALVCPRPAAVTAEALYRDGWMFHGQAYQGIVALGPIAENGIQGEVQTPTGAGSLLDNMGQLAGYWVMEQPEACLAMPIGLRELVFHGEDPEPGTRGVCEVRVTELSPDACQSDLQFCGPDGRAQITMRGWTTRRYDIDPAFWSATRQLWKQPGSRDLGQGVFLFHDHYDTAVVREHIARRYLSESERQVYEALPPRRRRTWLSGRVACKDAVASWVREHHDIALYPQEFCVANTQEGRPELLANLSPRLPEGLNVSISHKDQLAVAMVGTGPVGVDLERVVLHPESVMDGGFSPEEQALLAHFDEALELVLTRAWVAKEVVAKALGTGLQGDPRRFRTDAIEARGQAVWVQVLGHWVETQRLPDPAGGNEFVLGWLVTAPTPHTPTPHTPSTPPSPSLSTHPEQP